MDSDEDESPDSVSASSAPSVLAGDCCSGAVVIMVGCGDETAGFPGPDVNWKTVSSSSRPQASAVVEWLVAEPT